MWDAVKDALVAYALQDALRPWQDAAEAWRTALREETATEADRAALWSAVDAVHASLAGIEKAIREARRTTTEPALRRALAQTAYAAASTRELVERHGLPWVERELGPRGPEGTRWRLVPVSPDTDE